VGGVSGTAYVLLPPSESKEPGGRLDAAPGLFDVALASPRERVLEALSSVLSTVSPEEASRLLKVRGPLLERALDASRQLAEGTAPLMPAWQRYNGVVWSHLDCASLDDKSRSRILVPSGLYGLSLATDSIADHRLTMKVSLGGLGNVARFWRPSLTRLLEELDAAQLVSFLPKEHTAAIGTKGELSRRLVDVSFVRHDGEGIAGHDAKAVKGIVSRRVLEGGVDAIEGFRWKGWRGRIHQGQYLVRSPRAAPRGSP